MEPTDVSLNERAPEMSANKKERQKSATSDARIVRKATEETLHVAPADPIDYPKSHCGMPGQASIKERAGALHQKPEQEQEDVEEELVAAFATSISIHEPKEMLFSWDQSPGCREQRPYTDFEKMLRIQSEQDALGTMDVDESGRRADCSHVPLSSLSAQAFKPYQDQADSPFRPAISTLSSGIDCPSMGEGGGARQKVRTFEPTVLPVSAEAKRPTLKAKRRYHHTLRQTMEREGSGEGYTSLPPDLNYASLSRERAAQKQSEERAFASLPHQAMDTFEQQAATSAIGDSSVGHSKSEGAILKVKRMTGAEPQPQP